MALHTLLTFQKHIFQQSRLTEHPSHHLTSQNRHHFHISKSLFCEQYQAPTLDANLLLLMQIQLRILEIKRMNSFSSLF